MEVDIADDVPCSSIAVDSVIRMGTAGLIWGSCTGPYDADKLGLAGIHRASFIAKSVGRFGFQWGMFAAIFSSTRCGLQRYRRRNDWLVGTVNKHNKVYFYAFQWESRNVCSPP
ncbi:outer envelope pore protein 16-4, chloroplastic isoform X2 [Lycium barbarum]|uniref:outer envelope pore protein 16-4, chloroplastic isoform X2 n=1 Tax=Lycium barbarum TaxID=112863 RepID=UPI00293F5475|nr:outer envelope pore protein 16-4, chloroplastic isoform X2 [Lycium barbarum]